MSDEGVGRYAGILSMGALWSAVPSAVCATTAVIARCANLRPATVATMSWAWSAVRANLPNRNLVDTSHPRAALSSISFRESELTARVTRTGARRARQTTAARVCRGPRHRSHASSSSAGRGSKNRSSTVTTPRKDPNCRGNPRFGTSALIVTNSKLGA